MTMNELGGQIAFTMDGVEVAAVPGQLLAAALIGAGVRTWGSSPRTGRSRGLFCGIGVCYSCLVVLNGRPNTRACLVRVVDGDVIASQNGLGHADLC